MRNVAQYKFVSHKLNEMHELKASYNNNKKNYNMYKIRIYAVICRKLYVDSEKLIYIAKKT